MTRLSRRRTRSSRLRAMLKSGFGYSEWWLRKVSKATATSDDQSEQAQNEIEQITSDAEEWFRIFGIQSDGSLGLESFQALVVCITQSSHGMLSENDILPVLIRHAGLNKTEDTSCGSKELEILLHSITGVKPFKHAGTVILEEIRRSEGTTLKREGHGWKSVVHQMKKEFSIWSLKCLDNLAALISMCCNGTRP